MYVILLYKGSFRSYVECTSESEAKEILKNYQDDGFKGKILKGEYL